MDSLEIESQRGEGGRGTRGMERRLDVQAANKDHISPDQGLTSLHLFPERDIADDPGCISHFSTRFIQTCHGSYNHTFLDLARFHQLGEWHALGPLPDQLHHAKVRPALSRPILVLFRHLVAQTDRLDPVRNQGQSLTAPRESRRQARLTLRLVLEHERA